MSILNQPKEEQPDDDARDELMRITKRILDRKEERVVAGHSGPYEEGFDLIRAKELHGHGNFEEFCKRQLKFSKATVERAMALARAVKPFLKSRDLRDFPPPKNVRKVVAAKLGDDMQAQLIRRLFDGDDGVLQQIDQECALAKTAEIRKLREHAEAYGAELPAHVRPRTWDRLLAQRAAADIIVRNLTKPDRAALIEAGSWILHPDFAALLAEMIADTDEPTATVEALATPDEVGSGVREAA